MSENNRRFVFVLMPFQEEFDDVYAVIRDACNDKTVGQNVDCLRADEIAKPGRITDQIIEAIRRADAVVVDLTGSNPNVMYEVGFAHALGKPTIIINQSVKESPFDVAGMRQIVYDRNRLVKDCRPRLVASLAEIFGDYPSAKPEDLPEDGILNKSSQASLVSTPLNISNRLLVQVQGLHVKMQLANTIGNLEEVRKIAIELINILDRISIVDKPSFVDLHNFVSAVGNCGVELEKAELFREAEDVWKRAIGLMPSHGGVHLQYGDFLIDRGRVEEAIIEAKRGRELSPNDPRTQRLETKIALASGKIDEGIVQKLREDFEKNRSDFATAAAYLMFLDRTGSPAQEFERVCKEWEDALPNDKKYVAVRALADYLAGREQFERAIELYERILPNFQGGERSAILHNMATVYANLEMNDKAETAWLEAYKLSPSEPTIQAAFSQRLANWGKLDLAVKVASGLPLE